MSPSRRLPKYVKAIPRGRIVHLYFRHGKTYLRLPRDPDSAEFHKAYAEALENLQKPSAKLLKAGSIDAMIADFKQSPEFTSLAAKTQRDYSRALGHLGGALGKFQAKDIRRSNIIKLRNKLAGRGNRTADLFTSVVSRCFKVGMDLDYVDINPASDIGRINDADPFKKWPPQARAAFEASNPPQHLFTAYMIGLWTAQGLGDVLRLPRSAYDGAGFDVRRAKTGAEGYIPVFSVLREHLATLPINSVLFVAREDGARITLRNFSDEFRGWLDGLGFPELHFHGLRKTTASALAEAGATAKEIQSITLHKTLKMVELYTEQAEQKRLATAAIHKLERASGTKRKRESGNT